MKMNNSNIDKSHLGIKNKMEMQLINIILNADGSTTRLLETLIGDKITVNVHQQDFRCKESLPEELTQYFKSEGQYLYRVISLYYRGRPISDNVVIASRSTLSTALQENLLRGQIPLGKLISETEHRREVISAKIMHSSEIQHLFHSFELPDGFFPIKRYIIIKDGESWFYICEVFHYKTISEFFQMNNLDNSKGPIAAKY